MINDIEKGELSTEQIALLLQQVITSAKNSPNAVSNFGVVNGAFVSLDEIEQMGINQFVLRHKLSMHPFSMPTKLYRYYPNNWAAEQGCKKPNNYSLQSLECNTVFMQSPLNFDDIFDSGIKLEWTTYTENRLRSFLRLCNCEVHENDTADEMSRRLSVVFHNTYMERNTIKGIFFGSHSSDIEELCKDIFLLRTENKILNGKVPSWNDAICEAVYEEYMENQNAIRDKFRVCCFTPSPYSQLMWGGRYADEYRGFCVEYDINPNEKTLREEYLSLFPVIYCKTRPDITEFYLNNMFKNPTEECSWKMLFHGNLRKSIDWFYQSEWRLLKFFEKENTNYSIPFFPITKVFLGCRMAKEDKNVIIEICNKRNIPYAVVRQLPGSFDLGECTGSCENCKIHCWE